MFDLEARTPIRQPPTWALQQRDLFDVMATAVDRFVEDYFDDEGAPYWPPDDHVGVDGFDDVIEGFFNWPLAYAMGGDRSLLDNAREAYERSLERGAGTETPFGHPMVVDEFEQCRDWFHLGEGNLFTYNMGLAVPGDRSVVERAERFAGLYLADAEVENYDPERKLVRGPMNGSMGPDFCDFSAYESHSYGAEYRWQTHGLPWRDVPGIDSAADLKDPDNEELLFDVLERRCSKGDIPLNLGITSMLTNAYLHTGDERYREWVLEYVEAWQERTEENGGIVPDNVGRSGEIGEYNGGDWYGGYYGWSWGGWHYVGVGVTTGSENAALLTGDRDYLDFLRSQLDVLREAGIEEGDTLHVPHKYGDPGDYHYNPSGVLRDDDGEVRHRDGWYEFRPHRDTPYAVHLWYMTMADADYDRVRELGNEDARDWQQVDPRAKTKHGAGEEHAWLAYLADEFPAYPEEVLAANRSQVHEQVERIRAEGGVSDTLDEDYLRDRNPVFEKGLLNLTMGAPQPVYYGGLLMAQVRHFDPERSRPGLPEGVAALVEDISDAGVTFTLVNLGAADRDVITQAGAYGEHTFTAVQTDDDGREETETNAVRTHLPSGSRLTVSAEMARLASDPSYALPWD